MKLIIYLKALWYHLTYRFKKNEWQGRYSSKNNDNRIILSLRPLKNQEHSDYHSKTIQKMAVYNYEKEQYEQFEITDTGFKNVETGEIVDSPFTTRHLNEMKLQTELMKQCLGEKDN